MRQPIRIIGVGLVCGHVERGLGMAGIDANGRKTLCAERVIEPHRQRPGFEDHAFRRGRMLAQQGANTSITVAR